MPAAFLHELDAALGRIDRYWKVPCDQTAHTDQTPIRLTITGTATWSRWW